MHPITSGIIGSILALQSVRVPIGHARVLASPALPVPAICGGDTTIVSAFVQHFIAELPASLKVPRGAFVLVCGGHPEYAWGYGKTAAGAPVNPARTIFRAASNSKLFAATAALQLAERGMWSLIDDVNRYLPVAARLESGTFQHPVTLDALLTHTAGFENKFAGGVTVPTDRVTLARFFASPPRRVREPGFAVSYSNVGMALVGYLVEVRSGQSFARYADEQIFAPLGMSHSNFDQPPPPDWTSDLADGPPQGRRDVVFNPYPAASLVATPLDMGRFIAAHLNRGALDASAGGGRVLSSESSALMHASHWRAQPEVPGVAYGFFEGEMNGHRTLFHTGDSGDHSLVLLLPGDAVGFYLVYTGSDEQAALRERFARDFMDRFFPMPVAVAPVALAVAPRSATELSGTYRTAAYSRSNYEKMQALFAQVVVRPGEKGGIALSPPGASRPIQLRPSGSLTFRGDSGEIVVFRQDTAGKVVGLTVSGSIWDPASWDRIGAFEDGRLHLLLFAGIVIVAMLRLTIWPTIALVRRLRRRDAKPQTAIDRRWWRWSAVASALLFLAPVAALATAFLSFRHPLRAIPVALLVLGIGLAMATVAGLALVPLAIMAWRGTLMTPARRVHLTLLAGAFVLLAPLLYYWRLLPA